MIEGIEYSKRLATLCALALCGTAAMAWLGEEMAASSALRLGACNDTVRAISRQIATRSNCGYSDLVALRSEVKRSESLLGSEDTLETLVRTFGNAWAVKSEAKDDRDGLVVQCSTFRMLTPTLEDWQKVVELVGALERLPGVGIDSFRMNTSGDVEHREVETMEVIVETRFRSRIRSSINP